MVTANGKLDAKFWLSVGGLFLAILGTWATLTNSVTQNSTNIERNREQINSLAFDLDRRFDKLEKANHEILMELRK